MSEKGLGEEGEEMGGEGMEIEIGGDEAGVGGEEFGDAAGVGEADDGDFGGGDFEAGDGERVIAGEESEGIEGGVIEEGIFDFAGGVEAVGELSGGEIVMELGFFGGGAWATDPEEMDGKIGSLGAESEEELGDEIAAFAPVFGAAGADDEGIGGEMEEGTGGDFIGGRRDGGEVAEMFVDHGDFGGGDVEGSREVIFDGVRSGDERGGMGEDLLEILGAGAGDPVGEFVDVGDDGELQWGEGLEECAVGESVGVDEVEAIGGEELANFLGIGVEGMGEMMEEASTERGMEEWGSSEGRGGGEVTESGFEGAWGAEEDLERE